jgi:hypothetical protein
MRKATATMNTVVDNVFLKCVESIRNGTLIRRISDTDKEYHFQNWFQARLEDAGEPFDVPGRNSYPDFRMVNTTDGFEVKGLAYPGREANFDSNSQIPTGFHNGRTVHYVFGRYPKTPDGNTYPVLDLVICHGDFLNAAHDYIHKNKNIKAFGTYGDILIRDRKMYVVPTPFNLVDGVAHNHTLILPSDFTPQKNLVKVGLLCRRESDELVVGYEFDLRTNALVARKIPNPHTGKEHCFTAWRLTGSPGKAVSMRQNPPPILKSDETEDVHD